MRADHPVARSDEHGGFWVVTRHEDVLRVAQDWQTFSSAQGCRSRTRPRRSPRFPNTSTRRSRRPIDALINAYFTHRAVARYEAPTRDLVTRLIDDFVEDGRCDFMAQFARPFPGLAFFDMVLDAPSDDVAELNDATTRCRPPRQPRRAAPGRCSSWITDFVDDRRRQARRDDVVDAMLHAEIEGRPITETRSSA